VAQYLRQELHGLFESVDKTNIPELYLWIKEVGGYFKRYRGGVLEPWVDGPNHDQKFDLEARATQAFFEVSKSHAPCDTSKNTQSFQVDRTLSEDRDAARSGATASVALLHSLDVPATPFFSAQKLALTVAHCG
jgi:protein phosphatase PTC6